MKLVQASLQGNPGIRPFAQDFELHDGYSTRMKAIKFRNRNLYKIQEVLIRMSQVND